MGSDENRRELKCTKDGCNSEDGSKCTNGVCLDNQCHCNDGFGGCNCQTPDENECKYRPCDVFAHCTNTLGSFSCTCFPGYIGDGLHCEGNKVLRASHFEYFSHDNFSQILTNVKIHQ